MGYWASGSLNTPSTRIEGDEQNGFGMNDRSAVRNSAEGLQPMPKDRGAEQGYVGGPPERSLAPGVVASETWLRAAGAAGAVPWIGVDSLEEWQSLTDKH